MTEVYVVLSTYNGEKFLVPQLQSILKQQSVRIKLLIRDDGSTDATKKILDSFAEKYTDISLSYGENVGVIKSFMILLGKVPADAKFIAFCDQDDIWHDDKLIHAINKMNRLSGPVMYSSCYNAVDEKEQLLWQSSPPPRAMTFNNAVIENITTGCTVIINRHLLELMNVAQVDTEKIVMHDWWAYLVATCFGQVIFDERPTILYRQHPGNVVGVRSGVAFWLGRLKRFIGQGNSRTRISQAREFLKLYRHNMSDDGINMLTDFICYRDQGLLQRIGYALHSPVYMQKKMDHVIVKLQLLLGAIR